MSIKSKSNTPIPIESWNLRNSAIHAACIISAITLAAFISGLLGLRPVQSVLLCLAVLAIVLSVLVDLFPLKTSEATNVRRPQL